jgi:tetratricopeptide (TPR) repeat protein
MEDLNSLFDRAVALHEQNQLLAAAEIYSKILTRDPGQLPARNCFGILRFQEGRHAEALAAFDIVQQARPDFPDLCYNRGTALAALGRDAEALDCFDKALEIGRTIDALYNRGVALLRLGRFMESLASLTKRLVSIRISLRLGTIGETPFDSWAAKKRH